jgi:hypothetical protein
MFDCANVEMREQLPELLHGRLDPVARAMVEAHVASCADCAAELELLRAARTAFSRAPAIDTSKIVRQLPRPATTKGWLSRQWQLAAAISVVTLGGLTLVIARNAYTGRDQPIVPTQSTETPSTPVPATDSPRTTPRATVTTTPPQVAVAAARASITFGGGVDDLSDAEVQALLAAIVRVDAKPSEDPDSFGPLVPIDTGTVGRRGGGSGQ